MQAPIQSQSMFVILIDHCRPLPIVGYLLSAKFTETLQNKYSIQGGGGGGACLPGKQVLFVVESSVMTARKKKAESATKVWERSVEQAQ